MSTKYPGGIISKTAPTPSGPYSTDTAPGIWTLEQQAYWQKLGQWPTQGNVPLYIEDVFSTYLYTGNGSTQTITNGIDLAGKGGLVWTKARVTAGFGNELTDTVRGAGLRLISNTTGAQGGAGSSDTTGFTSSGFQLTFNNGLGNLTGENYASWTFREQPKFFDIVTWTGDDTYGRAIPHNLGSTPGCFIIKCTSNASTDWIVYHSALGVNSNLLLNDTSSAITGNNFYNGIAPTSTNIYVGSSTVGSNAYVNQSGRTYVAYLYAHNAGGFGLTGTDNVISCGSFTSSAIGLATVDLGYEPQWIMYKGSNGVTNWQMVDNMRGFVVGAANAGTSYLNANTSGAEATTPPVGITNTGFNFDGAANITYIYIAIRRGPMKVPTSGTSVYQAVTRTGNSPTVNSITSVGFPPDSIWQKRVSGSTASANVFDRLIGRFFLAPATTSAETAANTSATRDLISFDMTGFTVGEQWSSELNANTRPEVYWNFRRAPSFFDVVCYTGNSTIRTINHNLGVAPELMIVKKRSAIAAWPVYLSATTLAYLNLTDAQYTGVSQWNSTAPTSTVFTVATSTEVNASGETYVNYLFATCAGVSKVGSYTGTGTTKQIDCGFTGGARFVLIKRTDSTGDWYVWDSARGIVAGNDPYLLLNSTAAEVTGTDYVDTYSAGFEISSTAPSAINASGGTFIFLAIA